MRWIMWRVRLALARWLLGKNRVATLQGVQASAEALYSYALHSGHLTRVYHAGRRVRDGAAAICTALEVLEGV